MTDAENDIPVATTTVLEQEISYAGFFERLLALLIDALILFIPNSFFAYSGSLFLGVVLSFFYYPFFESSFLQATIGKRIMGLQVIGPVRNRISFRDAAIRWIASWIGGIFLSIGYLIQVFTQKRQTFGDLVAETFVIHGRVNLHENQNPFTCWLDQVKSVIGK